MRIIRATREALGEQCVIASEFVVSRIGPLGVGWLGLPVVVSLRHVVILGVDTLDRANPQHIKHAGPGIRPTVDL